MDCVFFDTLVGGSAHDLTVPGVQQDLLRRLRAREFAAVRSSYALRFASAPPNRDASLLVSRSLSRRPTPLALQ